VTCYGATVNWDLFEELLLAESELESIAERYKLSTAYLYGLLQLTDMASNVSARPENALWHSWFAYRTRRMIVDRIKGINEDERRRIQHQLAKVIAGGIERYSNAYRIALYKHLYQRRT
jgi:CRISPR-associated protein Csm1